MISRTSKQAYIGGVFIILFGLLSWGVVDYLFIPESSCSDGIKNGKEEGVDCGTLACGFACPAAIEPLKILSTELLEVSDNDYDVLVQYANPNGSFGIKNANYLVELYDENGETVASSKGEFYAMPGQTSYLVIQSIKTDRLAYNASFNIENVTWQEMEIADIPSLPIRRDSLLIPNRSGLYAEYEGIVFNSTFYDFNQVDVRVILLDEDGNVVGAASTDLRTFPSKTERGFRVFWPNVLDEIPVRAIVEASANVFENSNFIRTHGNSQEYFQTY